LEVFANYKADMLEYGNETTIKWSRDSKRNSYS